MYQMSHSKSSVAKIVHALLKDAVEDSVMDESSVYSSATFIGFEAKGTILCTLTANIGFLGVFGAETYVICV